MREVLWVVMETPFGEDVLLVPNVNGADLAVEVVTYLDLNVEETVEIVDI